MKEKIEKIPWLAVGAIGAISFLFLIVWVVLATNGQTQRLQEEKARNIAQTNRYVRRTKDLSPDTILNILKKENINVTKSLDEVSKNIKEAVNITYSQTKTEKDYKNLSKRLPKLVGKSLGYSLIQADEPKLNQSGDKTFPYGSTTDVLVTFGKYNYETVEIPVYLVVDYLSPKIKGSTKKIAGQDLYTLTYNLKTKQLGVVDHQKGLVNRLEK